MKPYSWEKVSFVGLMCSCEKIRLDERKHMSPTKLTCSKLCCFIAQLVEHCPGIEEVVGLNPVETGFIFQASIGGHSC